MRGAPRRTSSHASYSCENSRSRPISVSASKRRSHRSDTCPAGCRARRRPSRSRSAIRTRSALGLAPSSSASRASNRPNALSALVRSPTHARASINPRTASSDRGSRSSSTCAWRSTVAKSPVRRPASICFTRQSRIRGMSRARHSSFHCSNCTAPGTSKPSRNGPRISASQLSRRRTSASTTPGTRAIDVRCTTRCSRPTFCFTTVRACASEWRGGGGGPSGQEKTIQKSRANLPPPPTPHLLLPPREGLRQGGGGAGRRHVGPEEIHQGVTRELAPAFHREPDQQGEVFARAKADLLTRIGKQQRDAQTQEVQVRRQRTARGVSEWYY